MFASMFQTADEYLGHLGTIFREGAKLAQSAASDVSSAVTETVSDLTSGRLTLQAPVRRLTDDEVKQRDVQLIQQALAGKSEAELKLMQAQIHRELDQRRR